MNTTDYIPTVGIEEEYQLVDPHTGQLRPDCKEVMSHLGRSSADIQHELHLSQIEMASPVCKSMHEVERRVRVVRAHLSRAAHLADCRLVAAATNPLPVAFQDDVTPKPRYTQMTAQYQQIARNLRIFGCHVHVEIQDHEMGIEVMNRCRRWLPLLQAMSANSPFLEGVDTGYASFRRELWVQWPLAGPPRAFDDYADYDRLVQKLVQAEAISDETRIYWDIRLPKKTPTIEFRVFDVMTEAADAVAVVAIVRALVVQSMDDAHLGVRVDQIPNELLVMALWQAARFGVSDRLIQPDVGLKADATQSIERLAHYLEPALRKLGDETIVRDFFDRLETRGTGADYQRRYASTHGLDELVLHLADRTLDTEGPRELIRAESA